jgi:hypothetical protein
MLILTAINGMVLLSASPKLTHLVISLGNIINYFLAVGFGEEPADAPIEISRFLVNLCTLE